MCLSVCVCVLWLAHPFVQAVRVLGDVHQPLRERVAAGVPQRRVLAALQPRLGQQDGPDLAHRLAPLLLPEGTRTLAASGG